MSELYIIVNNDDEIHGIYTDLQKAKDNLIEIYKNTPDFKLYGYRINVYQQRDGEYIFTNRFYQYENNFFQERAVTSMYL